MIIARHYSQGSVTVAASGTAVVGTGTGWAGMIRAGDVLWINGLSCRIASVNSATSLTLARPWPGAAVTAGVYEVWLTPDEVLLSDQLRQLLDLLSSGNVEALAGLAGAADRLAYFTGSATMALTVLTTEARTLLGSTILSRSGDSLVTTTNARLTGGAVTQSATDLTAGRVMKVGDFGWGAASPPLSGDLNAVPASGIFTYTTATANLPALPGAGGAILVVPRVSGAPGVTGWALSCSAGGASGDNGGVNLYVRRTSGVTNDWGPFHLIRHSGNTVVDSNGFIKAASPIVRLFGDRIEEPTEATGATMTRLGIGHYELTGTLGLAPEGWQIGVPQDHNGNRLVFVETQWSGGVLTVLTSVPDWQDGRWVAGDPIDIPAGRWVDIRLAEPAAG